MDLTGAAAWLERVADADFLRVAAERGAEMLADGVRARLSGEVGGGHAAPWLRTGALRDSIGVVVAGDGDGMRAVVGSSDPAAAAQELGTVHAVARPFLAPVAAEMGEAVARAMGDEVRAGFGANF